MKNLLKFVIRWMAICLSLVMVDSVPMKKMLLSKANENPVCTTQSCIETGKIFKQNMNSRANPCVDFYEYSCGNWLTRNPKPESANVWSIYTWMQLKADRNMKSLMEDTTKSSLPLIEKAKALYKACVDLSIVDAFRKNLLKKVVAKIGNWPMFFPANRELPPDIPWWAIDDEYTKLTGESAFLTLNTVYDTEDFEKIILQIDRPFSPYGMITLSKDWKNPLVQKRHYKNFLKKVIQIVAPRNAMPPDNILEKDLDRVIRFRDELRKIIKSAPIDLPQVVKVGELQDWYNVLAKGPESNINWLKKVSSAYKDAKDAHGAPVTTATYIRLLDRDYFVMLADLLGKANKKTIVNHIHLYFAERNVKFDEIMMAELRKSLTKDPDYNDMIRRKFERSKWCIANIDMQTVLGRMYTNAYFTKAQKADVENMANETKLLIGTQIAASNWLDPRTKFMAIKKIQRTEIVIGYPDLTTPAGLGRLSYMNPLDVQAFYEPTPHTLFISAAYLQLPFYSEGLPYVVDYGSTVTVIGHELYHAVDAVGVRSDERGNVPWWPENMFTQYSHQAKCYENQYIRYRQKETRRLNMPLITNLPSTLNEDIADSMGAKVAYKGFKIRENEATSCPVLPGFENLGCDKLFFIAFANIFCAGLSPATEKLILQRDSHSLAKIRVNGAVANMPEFSAAFGCQANDPLNLKKRCDIWIR